jgi:chromatin remodeling complex protein RSC6
MVRATKSTTTTSTVAAPVSVTAQVDLAEKKTKSKAKKDVVIKEEVPVVMVQEVAVSSDAVSSDAEVVVDEKMTTARKIADEMSKNSEYVAALTAMSSKLKSSCAQLNKLSARLIKEEEKRASRKKGTRTGGKSGGFNKPSLISDELAAFIGVERGSQISRKEVNAIIHTYVVDHNLRNPTDKRKIVPDAKLSSLLDIGPDSDVSKLGYFTIQTSLKRHYL